MGFIEAVVIPVSQWYGLNNCVQSWIRTPWFNKWLWFHNSCRQLSSCLTLHRLLAFVLLVAFLNSCTCYLLLYLCFVSDPIHLCFSVFLNQMLLNAFNLCRKEIYRVARNSSAFRMTTANGQNANSNNNHVKKAGIIGKVFHAALFFVRSLDYRKVAECLPRVVALVIVFTVALLLF